MRLSFQQWFGSVGNWSSLWAYKTAISNTSLLPALSTSISQTNCQLFHAHTFLLHLYNVITNNFRIVHTNNQIHFLKKEIPFLAIWLSRKLVFLMGLQYRHIQDPFPPCNSFFTQPNKLLVSHASMYIYLYSKPCILISSSHLYKHKMRIPFLAYASYQHTKPFKM